MAEDLNKKTVELDDELLDEVSGGVTKQGGPTASLGGNLRDKFK